MTQTLRLIPGLAGHQSAIAGAAAGHDANDGEETRQCGPDEKIGEVVEIHEPVGLMGLVSRASPVHRAVRNCTRDEGGPFEVGNHGPISSRCKLLRSKAVVVSVAVKLGPKVQDGKVERGERKRILDEVSKCD